MQARWVRRPRTSVGNARTSQPGCPRAAIRIREAPMNTTAPVPEAPPRRNTSNAGVTAIAAPTREQGRYVDIPRAAICQTASTRSSRIAYIWSYRFTTGSQCDTISSSLSPTR